MYVRRKLNFEEKSAHHPANGYETTRECKGSKNANICGRTMNVLGEFVQDASQQKDYRHSLCVRTGLFLLPENS